VKERTKSDTYGLVLSSHGGGWIPADMFDLYMAAPETKAAGAPSQRFFGQDGPDYMDIADLSKALADFHTDYILFDACLMASVEALYDLRKNTDYVVASPIEVLSDGFPFSDIIPNLFLESHNLSGVCQNFMDYYSSRSGAISLVKTSELESLAASVKNIVAGSKATKVDATKIQGYEGFNPHIFYDLEQYMQALTSDKALLESFSAALGNAVLFHDHTSTFETSYGASPETSIKIGNSCGLSCYIKSDAFPQVYAEYLKTSWAKVVGLE
jgi:Clostripain family.